MENLDMNKDMPHMDFVLRTHREMKQKGIKLVYEGEINQSLTKVLAALTEKKLEDINEDISITRKVYHVMVECLQNICKHSEMSRIDECGPFADGIFMISEDENNYIITTGNIVSAEKAEKLQSTLDAINLLNRDEIKAAYIRQMKEGQFSEKGGAGLGFLDIAKKTGNKFEYHAEPAQDDKFLFVLKTVISKI